MQEHTDLIASIRAGKPINELKTVAESTLTAIMGREAAYTGQELTWDEVLKADLDLTPPEITFGKLAGAAGADARRDQTQSEVEHRLVVDLGSDLYFSAAPAEIRDLTPPSHPTDQSRREVEHRLVVDLGSDLYFSAAAAEI